MRAQGWRLQRLPDDRDAAIAGRSGVESRGRRRPTVGTCDRELATVLQPPARTVDNLIALHRASDSFTRLRPATKRGYEQCLELIRRWAVDESTGLAYSADRFRHLFAEIRARAAESTRSFEVDYLLPAAPSTARKRSRSR